MPHKATIDEMIRVTVGIWIEKPLNESNGCLLIKIPSHVIKSLYIKKLIEFNVRIASIAQKTVQGMVVRIYDDPGEKNHTEVDFAFSSENEYELFAKMIRASQFTIHFFDERTMMRTLPNHVMTATSFLSDEQKTAIEDALDHKFSHNLDPIKSLAEFSQIIQHNSKDKLQILANIDAQIELKEIQSMTSFEAPLFSKLTLDSADEGTNFEASIFGCLFPLFPEHTYHSPYNSKGKELVDILCFDDNFVCFVQAKSLSIFGDAKRTLGQRIEKILFDPDPKKAGKAIRQALGTIREIRSGQKIYKEIAKTTEISIPNHKFTTIHALILISEMHHSIDWSRVADLLINKSDKSVNIFLHVIDLVELQRIALAMPTARKFNDLLIGR